MIINKLYSLFNPELYHGWNQTKSYFEGWYFKMISADENSAFAIIPGVAMDPHGNKHAFIQILNGKENESHYVKFDISDFSSETKAFEVKIENNIFSKNALKLDLENISCDLEMSNPVPWPSQWYSPGIMGPFSFVPFMQCYHGILSMNHDLKGHIIYKGHRVSFDGGKGYMEKDWGRSFPTGYVWMQSNHFTSDKISIKSSVARIPWLGSSFTGYIAGVYLYDRIIEFTTYNFTKLRKCSVDSNLVQLVYENGKHLLEIEAQRTKSTSLASPIQGFMDGRVNESMTSIINVKLTDKRNKIILLEDSGRNAGLEVAGYLTSLLK
jgi:hypothetical protein